tara:strand:+ start:107 stop:2503 length:2397 start_codon:yes stop_codon:yes gene_type:complete
MPNLVGIGLSQVPTNSMLGGLAYQDPEHASIKDLDLKNLSQINSEIDDTAVDVFVYDTRKDSDGGAWRKRTQHTSWYNETLGTATRGTRREFPAVAVIVSTTTKVTIYDGDDPNLPMWMVFNVSNTTWFKLYSSGSQCSCVTALNATLCAGGNGAGIRLAVVDFIKDNQYLTEAGYTYYQTNGIVTRNNTTTHSNDGGSKSIVNNVVNDVAMTVLPNAPIDDTTGLPVPTIAVATDGGVSVIKDDGTVIDLTYQENVNNQVPFLDIDSDGRIYWSGRKSGNVGIYFHEADLPSSDSSSEPPVNLSVHQAGTVNAKRNLTAGTITDVVRTKDKTVLGIDGSDSKAHLNLYNTTGNVNSGGSLDNFQIVDISKDYNTGYMHGDIKGAFLSDTDATNVSVSDNLVSNGTFDSNVDGWSLRGSGTEPTHSNGKLQLTGNSSWHVVKFTRNYNFIAGEEYFVIFTMGGTSSRGVVDYSGGVFHPTTGSNYYYPSVAGTYTVRYTPNTATPDFAFVFNNTSGDTGTLDNVSIIPAVQDRSVNAKGLQVFGTVTKSAVATGADLVAYTGWNSTNYLFQPYNSDLNFTDTMMIMLWVKDWQSTRSLLHRGPSTTRNSKTSFYLYCDAGYDYRFTLTTNGSTENNFEIPLDANQTGWQHLCFTLSGGIVKGFLNGEEKTLTANSFAGNIFSQATDQNGLWIGMGPVGGTRPENADIALLRLSASAPSAEQVKKIYEDEKHLFQENAKATLYGSSDAVTALAFDDTTNLLHVGTSAGRSEFQGLCRINNTTTAVDTAISASNGLVAEQ